MAETDPETQIDRRQRTAWIAADWGTTSLRCWAMAADGTPLDAAQSGDGMGSLAPEDFEPALLRLISDWLPPDGAGPVQVVICGMAGARQGWIEAPYSAVPCPPVGASLARAAANDPRIAVGIVPGLSQARPADVMRGEETQIAGLLAARPGFDGVVCLPGTHTKWAHVSAGEVVSFQTCMTGEIFALLAVRSVLRHALPGEEIDLPAFLAAVSDAMTAPQALAARLFGIRAESLLHGLPAPTARGRLSGLLIGQELAGTKPYWLGREVIIIGAPGLSALYAQALGTVGVAAEAAETTRLTLAGLAAARAVAAGGGAA
ncbi:MAG: 2-dehydro-3-deoxygalactonokinase [Rhodobacteraceae bacterium]|nr:2-dehydro-3-deoxygalactonokinase [Paracoccaceae bacterium]